MERVLNRQTARKAVRNTVDAIEVARLSSKRIIWRPMVFFRNVKKLTKGIAIGTTVAVCVWILVSFVNVWSHNLGTQTAEHKVADWNVFKVILNINETMK